jgi:hypothetical protein
VRGHRHHRHRYLIMYHGCHGMIEEISVIQTTSERYQQKQPVNTTQNQWCQLLGGGPRSTDFQFRSMDTNLDPSPAGRLAVVNRVSKSPSNDRSWRALRNKMHQRLVSREKASSRNETRGSERGAETRRQRFNVTLHDPEARRQNCGRNRPMRLCRRSCRIERARPSCWVVSCFSSI